MEKEFVPYKLALKLKELGFNEICLTSYNPHGELVEIFATAMEGAELEKCYTQNSIICPKFCSAPLWHQAFKFFREKFNLHHTILFENTNKKYDYIYGERIGGSMLGKSDTYEKAELECLKKLIELCKKN